MEWWKVLLLACWVILVVWVAIDSVLDARHKARCDACRTATRTVQERHPDWKVLSVAHRATEPERDVVAVFYMPPKTLIEPPPYQLIAIRRDGLVEELASGHESPYAIRGRK